jgi:hypothetical protein
MRKLGFALLLALVSLTPGEGLADRAIPDDNLAYPVLLSLDTGSNGSGFFLDAGPSYLPGYGCARSF